MLGHKILIIFFFFLSPVHMLCKFNTILKYKKCV
jgi:hypothetical protein